jgi:hypothetical protein
MSKKLQQAIPSGTVKVRNRTSGEVAVTVALPDGTPTVLRVPANGMLELAPRFTTADMLQHGNLLDLLRNGHLSIM